MSVTAGNYAPRRRTVANVSKRLMSVIKQFREAEAKLRGERVDGWGEMMQGLDEEDPKGRGTGKAKGKKRAATELKDDGEDELRAVKEGTESNAAEVEMQPKKRKTRERKGTVSSVATTEDGTEAVELAEDQEAVSAAPSAKRKTSGRGRGRGRGTRRWKGERWDVIQKPD
jgi:DNA excision repair protein ERCC-5